MEVFPDCASGKKKIEKKVKKWFELLKGQKGKEQKGVCQHHQPCKVPPFPYKGSSHKKQSRCSLILLLIPTLIDVIGRAFHSLSVINDTVVVCGGLGTSTLCTGCFFFNLGP